MVEKDVIAKEQVKFAGFVDFKELYNFCYDWLKGELFNIIEVNYTEKVKGDAKELEIVWQATKKVTDYFRILFDIKWKILEMKDVEVEIDGKKKKMNKLAELKIDIKGTLEKDYNSKWEITPTMKFFKEFYQKYIIPNRTEQMEEKVQEALQEYKEEIKAFLELTGKK
ncbi:MAG: hypothetical protein Q8P57_00180 [Candidatus Pacearchaeota archaeon]|nr:hypothetical protein [Candidatus Pacearchaeota archaeon]